MGPLPALGAATVSAALVALRCAVLAVRFISRASALCGCCALSGAQTSDERRLRRQVSRGPSHPLALRGARRQRARGTDLHASGHGARRLGKAAGECATGLRLRRCGDGCGGCVEASECARKRRGVRVQEREAV